MQILFYRSVVPSLATKQKHKTVTIKVTLAEKKGGRVLNYSRPTYIVVEECSANVIHIQSLCRQEFEDETLSLVSGNGLKIEDCEATRG